MPNGNGGRLTNNILERLESLDDKMDKVLQRTAAQAVRISGHDAAIRWLFGIVAIVVTGVVLAFVGAR